MIRKVRMSGFVLGLLASGVSVTPPLAMAGDGANPRTSKTAAPLEIPHTSNLELSARARKRAPGNLETSLILDLDPALTPLPFPRNSDLRARLLTPELRRTPLLGWIAENLYRSRSEKGWCLEADPGQGEYVVFYRLHLK
ncbi:MAG TPA: hypothetical protein VFS58_08875 [Steroidobacteraceae bacterium]|nr:hypothetical protein [Steroidobacteraceae bacterium]